MHYIPVWLRSRTIAAAMVAVVLGASLLIWHFGLRNADVSAETLPTAELSSDESDWTAEEEATPLAAPALIVVYVSGAVRAPDVYQLPPEARVKDLIVAAGGLVADADAEQLNLASRLSDGEHIHIPRQGEAPLATAQPAGATHSSGLLDLNTANADEFEALPGIGSAIAERIVVYRDSHGPFASIEELSNVSGIGPSVLEKITPLVTVGS